MEKELSPEAFVSATQKMKEGIVALLQEFEDTTGLDPYVVAQRAAIRQEGIEEPIGYVYDVDVKIKV